VAAIIFASAFVGGIAGFSFTAISSPVLWLLASTDGVVLLVSLPLCNQLAMVAALREEMVRLVRKGASS
jgi:hypothetical protein